MKTLKLKRNRANLYFGEDPLFCSVIFDLFPEIPRDSDNYKFRFSDKQFKDSLRIELFFGKSLSIFPSYHTPILDEGFHLFGFQADILVKQYLDGHTKKTVWIHLATAEMPD